MSPLRLRRYRAERLLRDEFEGLRGCVLASAAARLRASGVSLDQGDLEACYAQAWQGLYTSVLEGQDVANPAGWLTLVTFRRAIDEHRARTRAERGARSSTPRSSRSRGGGHAEPHATGAVERDLAAELDDRARLRQLFEGLCTRLDAREREAATLCYLQGLSRSQAAARMGVSDQRMRKLMEGRGPSQPGVAGKVGALVHTIRQGDWCEQQGSLMRAFAYGILDPQGQRYQLALAHSSQCPACRAHVASLRGLAAALPPVFLPWGLGAAVLARAGQAAHCAGAGGAAGATGAAGGGATSAGLQAGGRIGGAISASGAAGAGGAAGGGWLAGAGPLGAKLAVGCLLALGAGAGCVALDVGRPPPAHPRTQRRHLSARARGRVGTDARSLALAANQLEDLAGSGNGASYAPRAADASAPPALTAPKRASREFGPERALTAARAVVPVTAAIRHAPTARSASSASETSPLSASSNGPSSFKERSSAAPASPSPAPASGGSSAGSAAAAEREFTPG